MKNVFKLAAVVAGLSMFSGVANAVENIGYVNTNVLVQNHPLATNTDPKLVESIKADQAALEKEEKAIINKFETLKKDAPKLRSADIKKREDAINADRKAFEKKVAAFEKKVAEAENKVRQAIYTNIQQSINEVAKNKGYTLVIDANAVMYTQNENNDLTNDVYKVITGQKEKAAEQSQAESTTEKPAATK